MYPTVHSPMEAITPAEELATPIFSTTNSPLSSSRSTSPEREDPITELQPLERPQNVCFIGAGYVGGPTAAVLALKCPSIKVNVVDMNQERIDRWNSKHLPVHEPGLDDIVRLARDGSEDCKRGPNLSFTTEVQRCIAEADVVFIAVNTPTKACGIGAGAATNLAAFEGAVTTASQYIKPGAILVEKSTVPCGTAQTVREILSIHRPTENFEVLSNPEFLAEGTAIPDLLNPDRVLIGCSASPQGQQAANVLKCLYTSWVDESKILTVNTWSSELSKLVANAMLAQRISSINSISAICDETGADIEQIADAIGRDVRLGSKFLKAGVGFGGSCFKKDILNLVYLARSLHLPEVADYWLSVLSINDFQMHRFTQRVVRRLHGALAGKKITVLGFTFKQDTNDTRESPAIEVVRTILSERPAEIAIFDPGCTTLEIEQTIRSSADELGNAHMLAPLGPIKAYATAFEACRHSSAILILTPWDHFRFPTASPVDLDKRRDDPAHGFVLKPLPTCADDCSHCALQTPTQTYSTQAPLDWPAIAQNMRAPKWVFDGRNVVDRKAMGMLGFRLENIGKTSF